MATQFSGWKAKDGSIHATKELAESHEHALDFHSWCRLSVCIGGEWSAAMVAREVLDHWFVTPKGSALGPGAK